MANMQVGNIHAGDIAVIVVYLAGSLALGMYTILKTKGSIQNVFLAGRSMSWWPIGLSLFASNIGSTNVVGMTGDGAASGIAVIMFEWNAAFLLTLLGWVFLPVYIGSGIYTMPEYLAGRFGGKRLQIYLSVVALLTNTFSTVSANLYAGGLFMNQTLTINIYAAVALLLIIGLIFTGLGGLETVIITDALAVVVMVLGGLVLCIIGFSHVGGMEALRFKYMRAVSNYTLTTNTTCGYPREDAFHIFRHPWNADYPSVGIILRTTFGSIYYWCANQELVQRAIAAKNITHAKAGCILAGYLKLLPLFLMVFPGMISRVLFPNEVACADPVTCKRVCDSEVGCSNIALPIMVIELLPIGVRGLMVASVMAAAVSTLTSILNSSSTMFTLDIWVHIRSKSSQRELLLVGRVFTVVMVGISIAWMPVMAEAEGGQIFRYVTMVSGYLAAPSCTVFLLGMLWSRINEKGAFFAMIIAQAWGITRFILDMIFPAPGCGQPDTRTKLISEFHGYYHTFTQIVLAFLLATFISLATEKPSKEQLAGVTYWTRLEKPQRDREDEERRKIAKSLKTNQIIEDNLGKSLHDNPNDSPSNANLQCVPSNSEKHSCAELRERNLNKQEQVNDTFPIKDTESHNSSSATSTETQLTMKERLVQILCGSSSSDQPESDILEPHEDRLAALKQSKFWQNCMNANVVILLVITVFMYGFFY